METDEFGNKLKGFYLVGFFDKNKSGKTLIQKEKPFTTDENGISHGKCFCSYPTNCFPREWEFVRTEILLKEIHKHKDLMEEIDEIWKDWCKKHKRKEQSMWEDNAP